MSVEDELAPVCFDAIEGFFRDDLDAALAVFRRSAERIVSGAPSQRPARLESAALIAASRAALDFGHDGAAFFARWFRPCRVMRRGFVTAYYEPETEARLAPGEGFETPVLAHPSDLVTLNDTPLRGPGGEALAGARRRTDGLLEPYPVRRAIEDDPSFARGAPLTYVRDRVELFLMQVQGSARLRLPGGETLALTYDGRNGWPYTSIGRLMVERGLVAAGAMSLDTLKTRLRDLGLGPGQTGRLLMQENQSYVFFKLDDSPQRRLGPIGGEGVPLTPLRSIAVDRSVWSYGLPFWISARLPWRDEEEEEFSRLMIAQDTGSAILGTARADLFFGAGDDAGHRAGLVRHDAEFIVFLPRENAR